MEPITALPIDKGRKNGQLLIQPQYSPMPVDQQIAICLLYTSRDAGKEGEQRDILFFIDNIFRFTQAGSEVSALLGRIDVYKRQVSRWCR